MTTKSKDSRKASILTIGADKRKRIPQLFSDVYKIEATAAADEDDVARDETFKLHTLRTVFVEGLTIVNNGKGVNVNGDFDISLDDDSDETEASVREKVYADKDEAIAAWEFLTNIQLEKAEKMFTKMENTLNAIRTSKEERQY
jgi:hypothetical protein